MVNYSNGRIYKLVNDVDDKIYVGSTTTRLSKRKCQHNALARRRPITRVYKHLNEVGWEHVDIILIENYECKTKEQLHARERHWIEQLKPELNTRIPTRTHKEYYEDNKEKIAEKKKEWYQDNKEKIAGKKKEYYQDNKEKILQKTKEYYQDNKEEKLKYIAKYYQDNKESRKTYAKEIYNNNKTKILEKNKIKYTCECGTTLRKVDKSRHEKSKKHKKFISL